MRNKAFTTTTIKENGNKKENSLKKNKKHQNIGVFIFTKKIYFSSLKNVNNFQKVCFFEIISVNIF